MKRLSTDVPESVRALLEQIVDSLQLLLGDNLVGIYLHGSLAMGSFNPESSDIDFLIIVGSKLDVRIKRAIIHSLLELSKSVPKNGLEMSIVLREELTDFKYPTPYELHYSNMWKEQYLADKVEYEKKNTDPDLAAHFVITKERGICLFGESIEKVFPKVPSQIYLESIMADARDICNTIYNKPIYGVLNLCRVLAFSKAELITSKAEGGQWALQHIDQRYHTLVQQALGDYLGETNNLTSDYENHLLKDFSTYMMNELIN